MAAASWALSSEQVSSFQTDGVSPILYLLTLAGSILRILYTVLGPTSHLQGNLREHRQMDHRSEGTSKYTVTLKFLQRSG